MNKDEETKSSQGINERAATGPDPALALQALLVEYGTLRQESLAAIGHRIQIVNFTFAAASLVVAGLAASNIAPVKVAAVCLTAVPLLTFSAGFIWLGEHQRSQRAGRGMIEVEKSINRFLGEELVVWETSLARKATGRGAHMKYPYLAAVSVIFGAGLLAQLFGLLQASGLVDWSNWSVAVFLAVAIVTGLYDYLLIRIWKNTWNNISRHDAASRVARAGGMDSDVAK